MVVMFERSVSSCKAERSVGLVTKTAGRTQALSISQNEMRGNMANHAISYRTYNTHSKIVGTKSIQKC